MDFPNTITRQVGHGVSPDLKDLAGSTEEEKLRVIVSLSHAGTVTEMAAKAFAPREVNVTGAGGLKKLFRYHEF